jgi:hypothetical protein
MTEHRYDIRHKINLDVLIAYDGLGMTQGCATNFSAHGMLIKTNRVRLPLRAAIDIYFMSEGELQTIKGICVHENEKHVGVAFKENRPASLYQLYKNTFIPAVDCATTLLASNT